MERRRSLLRGLAAVAAAGLVGCNSSSSPASTAGDAAPKPAPPPEPDPVVEIPVADKVVIYGATGRVGSRILEEALRRGKWVTAVIHRTPLEREDEHLTMVKGDVLEVVGVTQTIRGHGAVISAVGGKAPEDDPAKSLALQAARTLIAAARRLGADAPRIVTVGSSTTLQASPDQTFLDELEPPPGPLAARLKGHAMALDFLRGVDDVEWTMATPPRSFAPGERTGTYRFGEDAPVMNDAGEDKISMEDFAAAIFDELEARKYIRRRFTVAY